MSEFILVAAMLVIGFAAVGHFVVAGRLRDLALSNRKLMLAIQRLPEDRPAAGDPLRQFVEETPDGEVVRLFAQMGPEPLAAEPRTKGNTVRPVTFDEAVAIQEGWAARVAAEERHKKKVVEG